jgi:hypothetical protein
MAANRALPPTVLARLRTGLPVLVLSANARGTPHSTYSWAVAVDAGRLCVAVDRGGVTSANLRRSGRGAVQIVGTGGVNALVAGRAVRLRALLQPAGFPAALETWALTVTEAKNQSWPGVTTTELRYRWPPGHRAAMRRMEQAIYAALRDADAPRTRKRMIQVKSARTTSR